MLTKERRDALRRAASADRGKAYWLDVDLSVLDVLDALDEMERGRNALRAEVYETRALVGGVDPPLPLSAAVRLWVEERLNAEFHAARVVRDSLGEAHALLEEIHNALADALGERHAVSGHVAGWKRWITPKLERVARRFAERGGSR